MSRAPVDPVRRLATRIAREVVKTLREGGAVVATPEELRESAKAHIARKRAEAEEKVRGDWDKGSNRSMPRFGWEVAQMWLDDWQPPS